MAGGKNVTIILKGLTVIWQLIIFDYGAGNKHFKNSSKYVDEDVCSRHGQQSRAVEFIIVKSTSFHTH